MDSPDLQEVFDAMLDGLLVVDEDGCVQRANAEACRVFETSLERVEGARLETLIGAAHPVTRLAEQVRSDRRAAIADGVALERRYGGPLEIDVAVSPLGETSASRAIIVALRDHTLRNSLSERLAQREELARYGHIAAGIAHEVKNPLGGIRGAAELLALWADRDKARETAEMIVREVDRITALVDELMVFARGDRLRTEPLNLHRVLDGVLQLLGMDPLSSGSNVERLYDPSIPELVGDPDRLTQVFLNLARNAMQAMEETGGGALTISTRIALDERLTDRSGQQIPTVLITIRDSGPGIAPEELERLTTPFYTTRSEGVGLGLAVARHWISRHNGTLRIESKLGEGATVQVALPLTAPGVTPEKP